MACCACWTAPGAAQRARAESGALTLCTVLCLDPASGAMPQTWAGLGRGAQLSSSTLAFALSLRLTSAVHPVHVRAMVRPGVQRIVCRILHHLASPSTEFAANLLSTTGKSALCIVVDLLLQCSAQV